MVFEFAEDLDQIKLQADTNQLEGAMAEPAIRDLIEASTAYARACDVGDYPALSTTTQELKAAARRFRWWLENLTPPEDVAKKWRKR